MPRIPSILKNSRHVSDCCHSYFNQLTKFILCTDSVQTVPLLVIGWSEIGKLSSKWRWEVSFLPHLLYPKEEEPSTHWMVQGGPKTSLGAFEKRKMKISCHTRSAVNFYHTKLFGLPFFISLRTELHYSYKIVKCDWNTV